MTTSRILTLLFSSQIIETTAWTNLSSPNSNVLFSLQVRRRKKDVSTSVAAKRGSRKTDSDEWNEPALIEAQRAGFEQAFTHHDLFSNFRPESECTEDRFRVALGIGRETLGCNSPDDEQCEIPEQFKSYCSPEIDVMAFLGIRRAEPLRVNSVESTWREWE